MPKIWAVGLTAGLWLAPRPAAAQVIPAQDSIQTQVVQQQHQFDIFGGTTTDNDTLLFHSFEQFDLERGDRADFHVAPGVEAVFSRIVSGSPSSINGALGLGGSSASLYLINPAGVLFGSDASLNLAGDFTVLTAHRMDFTQGYFGLRGHPTDVQGNVLRLRFEPASAGTIINQGNLSVGIHRSLMLLGHSVVNQGSLSGGAVTMAAVGRHRDVELADGLRFAPAPIGQTLPPWLTVPGTEHAAAIEIGEDGTLQLTGSQLSDLPTGTALLGGQLTAVGAPGRIQILGDHVATAGAALSTTGGGQILIGGDYRGSGTLPTAQSTFIDAASTIVADAVPGDGGEQAGGQVVIWSEGNTQFRGSISAQGDTAGGRIEVSGKEQLYFGGRVDVRSQGTPGTVLLDPENIEIRAGRELGGNASDPYVLYEDTLETSITGNVNLVLQADNDITIAPLSDGALTFAQGAGRISFLADGDGDGQGSFTMAAADRLRAPGREISITATDITAGSLDTGIFSVINNREDAGEIRLTATQGSITSSRLTSAARSTLNNSGNGGDIYLSAMDSVTVGDIVTTTSALNNRGDAGNIILTTQTGEITAGDFDASTAGDNNNTGAGGTLSLTSENSITTDEITTSARAIINNSGQAGGISLTSLTGNITTDSILAVTSANQNNTGSGGNISLTAAQGAIDTQQILSSTVSPNAAPNQGGDILLTANDDITVGFLDATGQKQGGDITVTTQQTFRAVDTIPTVEAQTSLLTTDDGTIHISYNSGPTLPFTLGDGTFNGTAGSITTGLDSLTAPQTVTQSVSLSTIELNNLFDPPSSPALPVSQSGTLSQANPLSEPVVVSVSPTVSTPSDSLGLLKSEVLGGVNNDEHEISHESGGEQVSTTGRGELIWAQIETAFSAEFAKTLDLPVPPSPSLQTTQRALRQAGNTQNISPALMYVRLQDTHVEIVLVDGEGAPVYRPVAATAAEVRALVETFHQTVTNPVLRSHQYLPVAQQLYDWLVRPVAEELQAANIDHIGFVLDAGLRSLPMAALHDGKQFLIERYSIGLLPSLGLTDMGPALPASEQEATLAMGIANFEQQANLAAVPFELELASQTHGDEQYLDRDATLATLERRLGTGAFSTVHLATHAVFQPGNFDASYVQLWDNTINLHQLKELPLDTVDFLILSACATALGDASAEFGFAGLAVNVGVRAALASLWSISDEGTLGLMAEFYKALGSDHTRSAALRQAQLAMVRGQVRIAAGTLYGSDGQEIGYLSDLNVSGSWDFSHPAYWSGLTLIGNPW